MTHRLGGTRALVLALALDWLVGEPPAALHPVVWMGKLISVLERHAPHAAPRCELLYGAGMTAVCTGAAAFPALLLERAVRRGWRTHPAALLLLAALLKTTFAWRTLFQATERVACALEASDLDAARAALRWLVSRDTSTLDEPLIAAAAIESLAENASDSVVAPLCGYALSGLTGAFAYRAVNTLDAMVGYRGRYEYLGKVPARLDDLLNLLPARLTALLIIAASATVEGCDMRRAWRVMWRDHACTASPNAGWPMSAIAGAVGVQLEKVGHYCINAGGRTPTVADIRRAERVMQGALMLAAGATGWRDGSARR
jgi:adenosylcobinamide-phosphate synthase